MKRTLILLVFSIVIISSCNRQNETDKSKKTTQTKNTLTKARDVSNNKTTSSNKQINKTTLVVDANRCPQNHRCPMIEACPVGAITQEGNGLPKIDQEKCIGCERCVSLCPKNAVHKQE